MSTALPVGEVKAKLFELVSRVTGQHERITITVHGRPAAVLMSVENLESIEETNAILSETDAVTSLIASEEELARGQVVTEDELRATMAVRRRSTS
jgi:prevent-host-death family protein